MQQVLNYTKAIVYVIASEHIVYDYIMRMLVKIMALTECQTSKPILSFFLDSYMRKGRSQFAPPPRIRQCILCAFQRPMALCPITEVSQCHEYAAALGEQLKHCKFLHQQVYGTRVAQKCYSWLRANGFRQSSHGYQKADSAREALSGIARTVTSYTVPAATRIRAQFLS